MIRKAVHADIPEIERVMRASMHALGKGFYDDAQVASAVQYIATADPQLIDDGTYFVIEEVGGRQSAVGGGTEEALPPTDNRQPSTGRVIACGGWSKRKKLFTGTSAQAATEGLLDPAVEPARIRAMFIDPSHSRRGLGRLILERSEDDARNAGFRTFELMATLPGVPLYSACGYEEIERTLIELPDGARLECARMRKV